MSVTARHNDQMAAGPERPDANNPALESDAITRFLAALKGKRRRPTTTIRVRGEDIRLTEGEAALLHRALTMLTAEPDVLTTSQAAEILNVSRTYLLKLLDQGDIPYSMVGSHRRLRQEDVMAYKRRHDTAAAAALDEMMEIAEEQGLYARALEEARR